MQRNSCRAEGLTLPQLWLGGNGIRDLPLKVTQPSPPLLSLICSLTDYAKEIKKLSARPPCISMQLCKCMDVHCSGARMPSGPMKGAQKAVPTGPMKDTTGGHVKEFCLMGIELCKKRWYLPL